MVHIQMPVQHSPNAPMQPMPTMQTMTYPVPRLDCPLPSVQHQVQHQEQPLYFAQSYSSVEAGLIGESSIRRIDLSAENATPSERMQFTTVASESMPATMNNNSAFMIMVSFFPQLES